MTQITVYSARKIITMDPNQPVATHVAVQDGRILAVGDKGCADQWCDGARESTPELTHDNSLGDFVLMPGFVEGHAHMLAGAIWDYAYAGYHDRIDPQGRLWKGKVSLAQMITDLKEYEAELPLDAPLVGWGFDPIFLSDTRLCREHLDQISTTRPIVIFFSNLHLMCVNSKTLELVGYSSDMNVEGIQKDTAGDLTGELQEMAAMFPVMRKLGVDFGALSLTPHAIRSYGEVCKRAGVTTATDLFSSLDDETVGVLHQITSTPDFPIRIVPALAAIGAPPDEIASAAMRLKAQSTDKLRMGAVKLMTDGSIQGWTARVKWPFYVGGQKNGLWNTPPEAIFAIAEEMQRAHIQMHIHVNGDEASDVSLNALEAASQKFPWPDARHVLQHCQMMGADQFRRAAAMGVCTNIFANHIWFFGDQHSAHTIGEGRAQRMNAARSALDAGVHIALHSDAPVTPMGPLFTAWCAVNRQTMSGRRLGPQQCITVDEALYAITLGAAYSLKLDSEIGSIETGKKADFAILDDDPTSVPADALRGVGVRGTVFGGFVHLL